MKTLNTNLALATALAGTMGFIAAEPANALQLRPMPTNPCAYSLCRPTPPIARPLPAREPGYNTLRPAPIGNWQFVPVYRVR